MLLEPSVPWWAYPLILIDFETTGPDPETAKPVSVAAVRLERGRERGAFYTLLDPGEPIPAEATAIHGITDEQVRDAPELPDVALELFRLAAGALPCGYNGEHYDKPILHRYIVGTDCPLFEPMQGWIDPLTMIRKIDRYVGGAGRHKLEATCARWGVPFEPGEAHNALADVRAVGRLLCELVRVGKVRDDVTLGRMIDYCALVRAEQQADFEAYKRKMAAKEAQRELDLSPQTEGGTDVERSDRCG